MRPLITASQALLPAILLVSSKGLCAQAPSGAPPGQQQGEVTFAPTPGFPTCSRAAVRSGDPAKAPSILQGQLAAGCVIPWHWHTPNEHLMLVSGTARVEAKGGAAITLQAGGFARMDSRHVHRFTCQTACVLFVYSDAPLDMHYVDANGKEISPAEALQAVQEVPARPAT